MKNVVEALRRRIFGYDIFISYSRNDGLNYSYMVAQHFLSKGYECYIDQLSSTSPGAKLPRNIQHAVKRSTAFVLVGSTAAQQSEPISKEIQLFLESSKNKPMIPISVDEAINEAAIWFDDVQGLALIDETKNNLNSGSPSKETLDRIENALKFTTKSDRLRRTFISTLIAIAIIVGFALYFVNVTRQEARQATQEAKQANDAKIEAEELSAIAIDERKKAIVQMDNAKKQKNEADSLKEIAIKQKDEADLLRQRADKEKSLAERLAQTANTKSQEAVSKATNGLGISFIQSGKLNLETNPALSLKYAIAAAELGQQENSIDLLKSAVERNPVWCRIGPQTQELARTHLTIPNTHSNDIFAVDPKISMILGQSAIRKEWDLSIGNELVIRSVPSGAIISRTRLNIGEQFNTPRNQVTRLVSTIQNGKLSVFELKKGGLEKPVASYSNVKDFSFSNGYWPLYILTKSGSVVSIDSTNTPININDEVFHNANYIRAHPSGKSIAIFSENSIHWIGSNGKSSNTFIEGLSEIKWEDDYNYPKFDVKWGPNEENLLLFKLSETSENFILQGTAYAFNLESSKHQIIHESLFKRHGLNRFFFEINKDGKTILVTSEEKDHGVIIEILNLNWKSNSSSKVTDVIYPKANRLIGQRTKNKPSYAAAASVAPNGNYIVVGNYLKSSDRSGTSINGVGLLESWDITRINATESEEFNSFNAIHFADAEPFAQGSILQPEPIFRYDEDPEDIGTVAILRLAYSEDSKRVLAWDDRGISHVFRVKPSHGYYRVPEEWGDKLSTTNKAERIGPQGRYLISKIMDGSCIIYDLFEGKKLDISSIKSDKILDLMYSSTLNKLVIVTSSSIYLVAGNSIEKVLEFEYPIRAALMDMNLITAFDEDFISFIDSKSFRIIGKSSDPKKNNLFHERLNQVFDYGDDYGEAINKSLSRWNKVDKNTYEICFRTNPSFESWSVTFDQELETESKKLNEIPRTIQNAEWVSIKRLLEPDILFVNRSYGTNGDGATFKTTLEQYELPSGKKDEKYMPPSQGWPKVIAGIEGVYQNKDELIIVLRYWPNEFKDHLAVGVWKLTGGKCLNWFELGPYDDQHFFFSDRIAETQQISMVHNREDSISTYDLSKGIKIWSGKQVYKDFPPPMLSFGNEHWRPVNYEEYKRAVIDIAVGGLDYWKEASYLDLPEEDQKSIEELELLK